MRSGKPPYRVSFSDPAVARLMPVYLERRQTDLQRLDAALAAQEFDTIAAIAHGLIGSGGLYGLQPITEFGKLLEAAAQARDSSAMSIALDGLRDYLDRLEIE